MCRTDPKSSPTDPSRFRADIEIRRILSPPPELSREQGFYAIVMAFIGPLKSLRYRADCWSLRLWRETENAAQAYEVMFPTPVDPTAFTVRLENGVLEFRFADPETIVDAMCVAEPLQD